MIQVNCGAIPNSLYKNYLNFLIGQLYKSLCLKEEGNETLISFLESLKRELIGNIELINTLKYDARFASLLNKVQYLISAKDIEHRIFRKEMFSCISIVKKLQGQYLKGGYSDDTNTDT